MFRIREPHHEPGKTQRQVEPYAQETSQPHRQQVEQDHSQIERDRMAGIGQRNDETKAAGDTAPQTLARNSEAPLTSSSIQAT